MFGCWPCDGICVCFPWRVRKTLGKCPKAQLWHLPVADPVTGTDVQGPSSGGTAALIPACPSSGQGTPGPVEDSQLQLRTDYQGPRSWCFQRCQAHRGVARSHEALPVLSLPPCSGFSPVHVLSWRAYEPFVNSKVLLSSGRQQWKPWEGG